MNATIYLIAGLIVLVVLTILGILSRYRRCKPNQVLVVFGKTSGNTKCKIVTGGVFVWPVVQDYA